MNHIGTIDLPNTMTYKVITTFNILLVIIDMLGTYLYTIIKYTECPNRFDHEFLIISIFLNSDICNLQVYLYNI